MKTALLPSKKTFPALVFTAKTLLLLFAALLCFGTGLYAGIKPIPKGRQIKSGRKHGVLKAGISSLLPPSVSYPSPQTFTAGQRVSVAPVSGGITPYGYNVYSQGLDTVFSATSGTLPVGITTDAAGDIYFTESADVYEMPAGGGAIKVIASGFSGLTDIKLDASHNIYLVDKAAGQVIKIAARKSLKTVIGTGIVSPFNIALDPAGNVYVGEYTGNNTGDIKKIAAGTGTTTVFAAGLGPVAGLAFDAAGNLFFADDGTNEVKEILAGGGGIVTVMKNLGGNNWTPNTLAIDCSGTLFASAFLPAYPEERVSIFYKLHGGTGTAPAEFDTEDVFTGITTDGAGNVYAASVATAGGAGNPGIIKYQPSGGFFINKSLPSGLNFDGNTGIISGIPLAAGPAANYTVTGYQTDSATNLISSAPGVVNITVNSVAGPAISYNNVQSYPVNDALTGINPINSAGLPGALNYFPTASAVGSGFNLPNGIAKDAAGNFYIADRGSNEIKKMTAGGTVSVFATGFSKPTGVAVDAAGNVYVADNGNNAVKKIPAGSSTPVLWGSGFSKPLGIAADGAGNVYVADKGNNAIKEILTNGTTVAIGGPDFDAPSGVAVDAAGNVYVADSGSGSVKFIAPGSGTAEILATGLNNPFGIAVDNARDVFVTNAGDYTVYQFTAGSSQLNFVGQEFSSPEGMMIDNQGNLYIADTGNDEIRLIQPAGGYFLSKGLPAGLSFDSGTGIISGTPTVITPASGYIATAWNPSGSSSTAFSLQVTANALLSGLALSSGTLSPTFSAGTTAYTAQAAGGTASITLTPTTDAATSTVKINGVSVISGTASPAIPLTVGQNTITTVVTAQDGVTTNTYTVIVTRPSQNANLAAVALSNGILTPAFAAGTTGYAASVSNSLAAMTLTPTTADPTATITVNGTTVTSGNASQSLPLVVGANAITIVVTAQDGVTKQTYTVTVTRAGSSNANLATLGQSGGGVVPSFTPGATGYTLNVSNAIATITLKPVSSDANATIKVNGAAVTSGTMSAPIALAEGAQTIITAVVTAQDGSTTKTYTLTVTRAVSTDASLAGLGVSKSTLNPVFASGTISYNASVANNVPTITVTPAATDANASIKVNGVAVSSGTASGPITLAEGGNTFVSIVVTAQNGTTTKTYTVTVARAPSNNAGLSTLGQSAGGLTPAFATGTTTYTSSVSNGTTTMTLKPVSSDANASIKVNGTPVTSGAISAPIALAVGANTITAAVTAQDGFTTRTYTITVTRAPSSNSATLANLQLSNGTLSPGFATGTLNYTASVANSISNVTVTPFTTDADATVSINGSAAKPGMASNPIALAEGAATAITTVVTSGDGTKTKTYTITVTRAASGDASLSALKISSGTLSPVFASTANSYTTNVANGVASITITPTTTDANATIKVNGTAVSSGTASGAIALAEGAQTAITTVVTAQNGTTTETYTVTVTRAPSANANLSTLGQSVGGLTPGFSPATTNYTENVSNATASMTLKPVSSDANAAIKVNGAVATSGTATSPIALAVGANTITTVVTAQNGATTKTYTLTVTRASGGADSYDQGISVTKPGETPTIADDGIQVHQGVSPNGDGINDFLQIDNIGQYPDNKLTIMNRNGQLIFETKGYDNSSKVFDGHSNKNGQMQLPGTYFYELDYTVKGLTKHKTGYIVLKY